MEFIAINFNKRVLPIIASFASGMTLGWMVGDNNARKHFHKYYPVSLQDAEILEKKKPDLVIPQAPIYNFYVYVRDTAELVQIQETLAETYNSVEKSHTQNQQSKVCSL